MRYNLLKFEELERIAEREKAAARDAEARLYAAQQDAQDAALAVQRYEQQARASGGRTRKLDTAEDGREIYVSVPAEVPREMLERRDRAARKKAALAEEYQTATARSDQAQRLYLACSDFLRSRRINAPGQPSAGVRA